MAVNIERNPEDRPPTSYSSNIGDQLRVPRTPLESRQGYHPKGVSNRVVILAKLKGV